MPGTGKNYDQFRQDDLSCRQFAYDQIGGATAKQVADNIFATSAIMGTIVGAAIGALAGGEEAAGIGAATGLFVGSLIGVDEANASAYSAQYHYDNAYIQCMYAQGHRVPVSGHIKEQWTYKQPSSRFRHYPPPPPGYNSPDVNR